MYKSCVEWLILLISRRCGLKGSPREIVHDGTVGLINCPIAQLPIIASNKSDVV